MDKNTQRKIDMINQKIKELNAVYHSAALKAGISDGEASILSLLIYAKEEYSQQDLCNALSLSKQTVNSIIMNLVKRQYVSLEHIPGTRNQKVIQLTEEGMAYGKEKVTWIYQAEQKALEQTDLVQIDICIEMIEKYILHFKEELNIG